MLTLKEIHADILDVTEKVISVGLSNKENYPNVENLGNGISQIGISGVSDLAVALKKVPYKDLYAALEHAKFYNFILADGGIIQMIYIFKN
ncbi:DUF2290 domain-containing protein, partial [Escherichia coli]|nr:DUF2290 domain-containing protein [Escherichia coli]